MGNEAFEMNSESNTSNASVPTPSNAWLQNIIARVKEIIMSPTQTWPKIKAENKSISDIYSNYLIVLAAIPPLCMWLGLMIFGIRIPIIGIHYRPPFFSSLIDAILNYGASLALVYIAAVVFELLAPKFNAKADRTSVFRLFAYAGTPAYVAGVFSILPGIGFLAMAAGGIYSIYLLWTAHPQFIEVASDKKPIYLAASFVSTALCGFVLFTVVSYVSPLGYSRGSVSMNSGNDSVDLDKIEESLKKLQNSMPKP